MKTRQFSVDLVCKDFAGYCKVISLIPKAKTINETQLSIKSDYNFVLSISDDEIFENIWMGLVKLNSMLIFKTAVVRWLFKSDDVPSAGGVRLREKGFICLDQRY